MFKRSAKIYCPCESFDEFWKTYIVYRENAFESAKPAYDTEQNERVFGFNGHTTESLMNYMDIEDIEYALDYVMDICSIREEDIQLTLLKSQWPYVTWYFGWTESDSQKMDQVFTDYYMKKYECSLEEAIEKKNQRDRYKTDEDIRYEISVEMEWNHKRAQNFWTTIGCRKDAEAVNDFKRKIVSAMVNTIVNGMRYHLRLVDKTNDAFRRLERFIEQVNQTFTIDWV